MHNMNYVVIAAAVTLLASLVPLVPMSTAVGAQLAAIAIVFAILGFATTVTLYFGQDDSGAGAVRDSDRFSH